jgi:hypothetical protein
LSALESLSIAAAKTNLKAHRFGNALTDSASSVSNRLHKNTSRSTAFEIVTEGASAAMGFGEIKKIRI